MKAHLHIGLLKASKIEIILEGNYSLESGKRFPNTLLLEIENENLKLNGENLQTNFLEIYPKGESDFFTVKDVRFGIDFHWEQTEDMSYKGALKCFMDGNEIQVVNIVDIEDYISSVVASEMNANAPLEFIKAHAIISRSWALAQLQPDAFDASAMIKTDDERIVWYDKENHTQFDLCADDHCQRYQGLTRIKNKTALEAVKATQGEVLVYNDKICDTRFSKCCGGISEGFDKVWQPTPYPYLSAIWDGINPPNITNLQLEKDFNSFLNASPDVFCNTKDQQVLSAVLNDYDLKTQDFFRWNEQLSGLELQKLILQKTGMDLGAITDLIPLERGKSGRLIRLKVVGTKRTMIFGKELEIRRILSTSHLYSSAFIVEKSNIENDILFTLKGAGWGHGVGLCQIGAAAMSFKGYNYIQILEHYFKGAKIQHLSNIQ